MVPRTRRRVRVAARRRGGRLAGAGTRLPLLDVTVGASDAWILQLFVAAVALSTLATVAARARDALPESQQDAVADVTAVKGQKS